MSTATTVKELLSEAGIDQVLEEVDDEALGFPVPKVVGDGTMFLYTDQIPEVIAAHLLNPLLHKQTLCFLGPSAIGKTEAIRAGFARAAAEMGREPVFRELHVSQMGPTDIMGVPRDDGRGRTLWYPPQLFPLAGVLPEHEADYQEFLAGWRATGRADWDRMRPHRLYGIFFDEVTNPSQPSIVHQCFPVWMEKRVADHHLVGDCFTVLAGNRVQDRTNSINLAASATSRLGLVEVVPRFSGWLRAFAMQPAQLGDSQQTRIHEMLLAWLLRQPDRFAPDASGKPQMEPFPSPRTWTFVSDILRVHDRHPMSREVLMALVAGRIGSADARQFEAFMKHWRELPDVNKLLNSPHQQGGFGWLPERWPKELDLLIILGTQLVTRMGKNNAKRFMAFMNDPAKFPPEVAARVMKLLRPSGKLSQLINEWDTQGFDQFSARYIDLVF